MHTQYMSWYTALGYYITVLFSISLEGESQQELEMVNLIFQTEDNTQKNLITS